MSDAPFAPMHDPGFCPLCGRPLRLPSAAERGHARCTACRYVHWENPLPVAGVLVVREGRVLLARRGAGAVRDGGAWAFPGSFVEAGETAEQAALRGAREQAGIEATITGIVGRPHSVRQPSRLVFAFRGETDGTPQPGHEESETRWFSPHEIPWDDASPSTAVALHDLTAEGLGAPAHPWTPALGDPAPARPAPHPFCRACGSAVRAPRDGEGDRDRCTACDAPAWRHPATGVGMFVVRDGRVLLARRDARRSRGAGLWTGPGGHIEAGETAEEAIVREMREEVDLHVTVTGVTGVYSERVPAVVHVSYLGETEGEPRAAHETAEVRWFAPHEVPWPELFADSIQPLRDLLARSLPPR